MSDKSITEQVEHYISNLSLKKNDLSNGRWYGDEEGDLKISATSFNSIINMGVAYDKWLMNNGAEAIKIRDNKALVGTIVHAYIDMLVLGEKIDLREGFEYEGSVIKFEGVSDDDSD